MQYMGSKNRIAKYLLPYMFWERKGRTWVEPFVGGANMIDKVGGKRIGNDIHPYLIALLEAVRDGWTPPTHVSRETYKTVLSDPKKFNPRFVGFVGFLCSFGGKWFGGYAFNNKNESYAERGSKQLVKQSKNLKGIDFRCGSYQNLIIPEKSLIYCDPPYKGKTEYENEFNHEIFWDWCRLKTREGHIVFISEYNAPKDFQLIKSVKHKIIIDKNSQYESVENLYRYNE